MQLGGLSTMQRRECDLQGRRSFAGPSDTAKNNQIALALDIRPSLLTGAFVRESAMRACSWVAARPRHLTAAAGLSLSTMQRRECDLQGRRSFAGPSDTAKNNQIALAVYPS
jgi:hypothetical protein